MPETITPVDEWTALEGPAGTDVANRLSIKNAVQRLSNRIEFTKNRALGGNVVWPVLRTFNLDIDGWRQPILPSSNVYLTALSSHLSWSLGDNLAPLRYGLNKELSSGQTLRDASVIVKPGVTRSTVGNRMQLSLCYQPHDYATPGSDPALAPTVLATFHDDGTNAIQRVSPTNFTPLTHVVDKSLNEYYLLLVAAIDAGTHSDALHAAQVFISDPGPRQG